MLGYCKGGIIDLKLILMLSMKNGLIDKRTIVKLGSRPCPGHVQVMLRLCSGHVQVISIPSPSQISRSGPGADSIIAMSPTTTNFSE